MSRKKKHTTTLPKKPSTNFLEDASHPWFWLMNHILAVVTFVSVAAVAFETVQAFAPYHTIFLAIEYLAVVIFTAEYVTRIVLTKKPLRYIFSFFGLIDLIAILPSYLGMANLTFLKAARAVRIIRLLRMMRLAKFAQIKRRKNAAQSLYTLNLEIYFFTLTFATLILGTMFYLFEHAHTESIPDGMYWTLSAILGGITYPQPETFGGTITLILSRFTSMILLGMLMGLIGTMIRKLLIGAEKDS